VLGIVDRDGEAATEAAVVGRSIAIVVHPITTDLLGAVELTCTHARAHHRRDTAPVRTVGAAHVAGARTRADPLRRGGGYTETRLAVETVDTRRPEGEVAERRCVVCAASAEQEE